MINQLVNNASSSIDRPWNTGHPREMVCCCCQTAALAMPPRLHGSKAGTVPRGHGKGVQTTRAPIQALAQRRASSKWRTGCSGPCPAEFGNPLSLEFPHVIPLLSMVQRQTGSHCKMFPPNPSPGLGHFSCLLWRCSILSPSLWRHDTSRHRPSPGHHQHSLGRETATGRGPAGMEQGECGVAARAGEAQQAVSMALERVVGPHVH